MKMDRGLKILLLNLSLLVAFLLCLDNAEAKTLKVDTVTPSITNGDFTVTPNGTGDIVLGSFSGVLKASAGVLSVSNINLTSEVTGVLPIANGGTGSSDGVITTTGDLLYYNAGWARLPIGTVNQLLTSNGTQMSWQDPPVSTTVSAKGDIQSHDGADNASLAVGTDGQILSADSGQTTGLLWIDVPVSTTLTTKGDLQTYDTANTRLPVGADGSFLVADSTETTGLKYSSFLTGTLNPVTNMQSYVCTVNNFTTGNGTVTCFYKEIGDTISVAVSITLGSTSAITGELSIDYPSGMTADSTKYGSSQSNTAVTLVDASTATNSEVGTVKVNTANMQVLTYQNASLSSTVPFTWATSDRISFTAHNIPIEGKSSGVDAVMQNKQLAVVMAKGSSTNLSGETTIVFTTEVKDNTNSWNGTTFTAPDTGGYLFHFTAESNSTTGVGNFTGSLHIDGSAASNCAHAGRFFDYRNKTYDATNARKTASGASIYCDLTAGEDATFIINDADNGTVNDASISIVQQPENFTLAGTFGDCQTKFLSADKTSGTTVADLNFSNLDIGKRYELNIFLKTSATSGSAFDFGISHDGVGIAVLQTRIGDTTTTSEIRNQSKIVKFTATTTTLTASAANLAATRLVQGNGTITQTHATLCELKKGEATSW